MKKCYTPLAFLFCSISLLAQDPVVKPIHAIPAETLKSSSSDAKKLPLENNTAVYSAEISKDKKHVTITPLPAQTPPGKTQEMKPEKK
ncbi:MAG: hypothetical protein ACJ77K_05465 [Bacteroidia bacterium]